MEEKYKTVSDKTVYIILGIILISVFTIYYNKKNSDYNTTNTNNTYINTTKNTTSNKTVQIPKEKVTVVDFSTMTQDDIKSWFTAKKVNGKITNEYSNTIPKGNFVSQSVPANSTIYEGDKITVVYSLGKEPTMEEKNALKKAESYSRTLHMSKAGIYKQLTSEYGEGFTEEAAQYAIDNINADWNANALAKAKSYQTTMSMSKKNIYNQLISQYGEQFTKEEAQYAIDHLED